MPTITVTPNTNIVLVNTASGDQTTVNLPPVTPGQLITIRDNVGAASSNNQITITTTGGSVFSTGTVLPDGNSNIKISQPFGAVTVGYSGGYKWNILNTFAFENPTFAKVDAVTVSSITFRDSIGNGSNYLLNVNNNILYRDGIKIIEGPEFNLGIARHNGGISSLSSIVSYGLSTVAAQPHYGLSSLSSIVSYGLSSLVGAGGSTPSNWAAYPALEDVNFGGCNITNVQNLSISGSINLPKFTTIAFGDPTESFSIGNNNFDNQSYLKLTGPTYIDGDLRLMDPAITGPDGTSLTYNGVTLGGGGDITQWAGEVASGDVNMNNYSISNASNINASNVTVIGTLTVGGVSVTGGGGGDASTWATYPATATVNMSNYSMSNLSNINLNGTVGVPSRSILAVADLDSIKTLLNDVFQAETKIAAEIFFDIYNNGSLWIAGGSTGGYTYYSINGSNWTKNLTSQAVTNQYFINNIIYADNKWVVVSGRTNYTNQGTIAYSTDGFTWSRNNSATNAYLTCIGYNGSKWVVGALSSNNSMTLATLNNITSDPLTPITGGFTGTAARILYANNIWVAVGTDSNNKEIQYSTNSSNWYSSSNLSFPNTNFFHLKDGTSLDYGNKYWLAGGRQYIYRSQDGINFLRIGDFGSGTVIDDIKYESGSTFYGKFTQSSANRIMKSIDNGVTWTNIGLTLNTESFGRIAFSYTPGVTATNNTLIDGGTLNTTTINTSNITVSGTLTLNSNTFTTLVNPIGAYIDLSNDSPLYIATYPLYIGTHNITTSGALGIRWWRTIFSKFSGIILLPGYTIIITNGIPGNNVPSIGFMNTGVRPQYNELTVNYSSNIIYTLNYNPT